MRIAVHVLPSSECRYTREPVIVDIAPRDEVPVERFDDIRRFHNPRMRGCDAKQEQNCKPLLHRLGAYAIMKRFKNILFVSEHHQLNQAALERALTLAENNQASLRVVAVIPRLEAGIGGPGGGPISEKLQSDMMHAQQSQLEQLVDASNKPIDVDCKVLVGTAFVEIIHEVQRSAHDLVIKVPEEAAWMKRLFGSDDMHLLRKCPCPVWLIKQGIAAPYRRILAAVDVEPRDESEANAAQMKLNMQILEMASSLALAEFAELHIAHVWRPIGETAMRGAFIRTPEDQINAYIEQVKLQHEKAFDELLSILRGKLGEEAYGYLKPRKHLLNGWARQKIPQLAKSTGVDLIVMGTVARTGVPGIFMGNTAEAILNQLECSVLAVKPPGFQTPVPL